MVGVDVAKVALYQRVQRVKAEMIAMEHNAGPGQIEVPQAAYTRIYHTILDLEEKLYGS